MSVSLDEASSSSAAATMTTRTAMRQNKLVVSAPPTVSRFSGTEPELETMEGAARLLDQLKPAFTTQLQLQAIGLSGRQLPLLTKDEQIMPHLFNAAGVRYVQPHPNGDPSQRILLLNVPSSSPTPDLVLTTIQKHGFELIKQHTLELGYDLLSSDQVLESLLPHQIVSTEGVPSGYTIVGHIAHLNLLDIYLPFRYLVGAIILSKHSSVLRTVVNKLDTIDTEFRFFKMELLAGEPYYIATVSESDCTFEFDFRSVYWNSRLHAEHMRLIKKCRPNQVLADVMAGVGPFAVPAAKRGTWVLANDLNPSSHESLLKNATLNKVLEGEKEGEKEGERFDGGLVGKCMDGREFVRWCMVEAWKREFRGRPKGFDGKEVEKEDERLREFARKTIKEKSKKVRAVHAARHAAKSSSTPTELAKDASQLTINPLAGPEVDRYPPRKLIDRFVMNLPATALEFLDAYRGAYTHLASIVGEDALRTELLSRSQSTDSSLSATPTIHVHCFSKDPFQPALDILNRANTALGLFPDSPHRLKSKPILPPPQTFAGLRKSSSPSSSKEEVGNYLTSHPDYEKYRNVAGQKEFMDQVDGEWQERDGGKATEGLEIHYVRDVAPNKQMYCLSFPCPLEVLWAPLPSDSS
ncbi:hypothetical protein NDA13_002173 [Ustilago tritici]|nr:hypothetical protein NDA13_002173 [Ustilago tritici]